MKTTIHLSCLCTTALLAVAWIVLPLTAQAKDQKETVTSMTFASPDEAIRMLTEAAKAGDKTEVHKIFGPDIHRMLTGDEVQDKANFESFSRALAESCVPEPQGTDKVILNIGKNNWPFPIPLVKKDGRWFFDTAAGMEEIINRHIGRDELYAIGVCRAYVTAQRQYYSKARDDSGVLKYAMKFKSTPGKQDGLYWKAGDEQSPFDALVAEAHAEGYGHEAKTSGPHAFHGYYFRILNRQGSAAPGGELDYVIKGNMTGGFALVAYPERWGKSGVMTFIVGPDGKVYQQCLDEDTTKLAARMSRYNPDSHWTLVSDQGIADLESTK